MSDSLLGGQQAKELDVSKFNNEEMDKINSIKNSIDIEDSQGVITYGVGAQRDISNFSDTILNEVRAKDAGYVGKILTDMVLKIKDLNINGLSTNDFFKNVPIIGNFINAVRKFIAKYEKLSIKMEKIIQDLDTARMNLLKDITMLDNLYEKNQQYLKQLDFYIAAGLLKIKELNEKTLPDLKAKAEASKDALDAQKYQDMQQAVNRFEKKIHDLKLSRIIAIQTAPQVRLVQGNNQALVEKIQSSILNTIPLWKNQIVIAISLFRQKKALTLQKEVSKTTNELLQKNAELLKTSSLDIAKENERGIVEIETLKKVNNDLIYTIEETLKIQEEGKAKRKVAEKELVKLEHELKNKLINIKDKR